MLTNFTQCGFRSAFLSLFLISNCFASAELRIYTPSPFVGWLCAQIGGGVISVEGEVTPESAADLAIYLDEPETLEANYRRHPSIILSDGLPLISYPEELADSRDGSFRELWLHPVQVILLASSLSDVLAERLPEHAESFFEAFAGFSKAIRLEDFQIKRRLRALERPIALSRDDARLLFPLLNHYRIEYRFDELIEDGAFDFRQPHSEDAPVDTFVRLTDQLLKSE